MNAIRKLLPFLLIVSGVFAQSNDVRPAPDTTRYTIGTCVNSLDLARIESTQAGYQYWFVDRQFLDGRTLKLSVVRPQSATHPPHRHPEDEFFFILEGEAEFFLNGATRVVAPYTSCYCPPNALHGIRNIGNGVLKYLVVKKYGQ